MKRRGRITVVVVALLAAGSAFFATSRAGGRLVADLFGSGAPDDANGPSLLAPSEDLSAAAREEAAKLRGFPGLSRERRGSGSVTGLVTLWVPDVGEKPLPNVDLELVGVEGGREARASASTGDDGAFSLAPVPALAGYVLRAKTPGRNDLVVRGIAVADGLATDVGHLVFGAPTSLGGSAVDALGRPIAGAVVAIERDVTRAGGMDLLRALRDIASSPGPVASGLTDADGRFLVKGLPPGRYLVRIERAGYATAFVGGVLVTAEGGTPDVKAVLDPGAGFEGRVLDPEGRGLEGALLVAVPMKNENLDHFDRHETRAGPDGRYRLDTLVDGVTYFLDAHLAGRAPSGRIVRASGVSPLDVTLVLGGRVEGRVTDAKTGAGIPSAEVLAVTGFVGAGTSPLSTVSDADGRYAFANVLPGPLLLFEARARGYAAGTQGFDAKAPRTVVAGATLVADVVLQPGGRITGSVRGDDGRVLAYVSVVASVPGNRWAGETAVLTDARGAYVIEGLRPDRYALAVTATGYASPVDDAESMVEVKGDGQDVVRDLVLASGAVVTGTITSADGAPVPRARVAILARDARRYGSRVRDLEALSDGKGVYRLVGVPPKIDLYAEASVDDAVKSPSGTFQAKAGDTVTVDIRLRKGSRILGRVADAGGRPIRGARVRFGHLTPEQAGRATDSFRADEFLTARVFATDDGGGFVCDRVPPGTTLLKVEADGYSAWFRRDLAVPEESDLAGITATLEGATTIRGRVLDATTGAGIGGAWVYAEMVDADGVAKDEGRVKTLVSAETRPDGTFVLEKAPPSTMNVIVWLALGYVTGYRDPTCRREGVRGGAAGVDFKLVPVTAGAPGK